MAERDRADKPLTVAELFGWTGDGGLESMVREYVTRLDPARFRPLVVVRRRYPGAANDRLIEAAGVPIRPIYRGQTAVQKAVQRVVDDVAAPRRLLRILRNERVDVLHVHGCAQYLVPIRREIRDIRLFFTCHSELALTFDGADRRSEQAVKTLLRDNGLQMIALHDRMRRELNERFSVDNTVVLRNGVDLARFRSVPESRGDIRTSLDIPQDAFVVGHVGRMDELKNQRFLVEVFAEIAKVRGDAVLLMVGDGLLRQEIEDRLKEKGLFGRTRMLSHRSDVPRLLKAMDVFIFPSKSEGLGIALIEAQAAGLRCVASDAVPSDAFCTPRAIPVSLARPATEWRDIALGDGINGAPVGTLEDWDIGKTMKRLEALYLGER